MRSVFEYTDYRRYLRDWLASRDGKPTLRGFARRAGVSPALVSQIVNGHRDLDPSRSLTFSRTLGHTDEESAYFVDIVEVEHGNSLAERRAARERVLARRRFEQAQRVTEPMARLLARWYYPAIAELARCPGFQPNSSWIADALRPRITEIEAQEALDTLLSLGVLVREGDAVRSIADTWTTGYELSPDQVGEAAREFHRAALLLAGESIADSAPEERHLGTFTAVISKETLPAVKALIARFQVQLLQCCEQRPGDQVYLVSVQLFPVSEPTTPTES